MSNLLGYSGVDSLYTFTDGLSPMLLCGPAGLGKRRWCLDKAEEFSGESMTRVLSYPKIENLEEYQDIYSGKFRNAWVIDLSSLSKQKMKNKSIIPAISSFLRVSSNEFTRVFLHSDTIVDESISSLSTVVNVPLLTNSDMATICKSRGYEDDETEFATTFAQGVPGQLTEAFSALRRRSIILEFRELLLEDRIATMEEEIKKKVKREDLVYLKNILTSFDSGKWTLFKEHEVSFLYRVKELMRNVLKYPYANAEICYVTVFHAAAHAYHGRV